VNVFNANAELRVGGLPSDIAFVGDVYRVEVWNGIGGNLVFAFDESSFIGIASSATSFIARTGQTVTVNRATPPSDLFIVTSMTTSQRSCVAHSESPFAAITPYDLTCEETTCPRQVTPASSPLTRLGAPCPDVTVSC
jgi:hypothetical protein